MNIFSATELSDTTYLTSITKFQAILMNSDSEMGLNMFVF